MTKKDYILLSTAIRSIDDDLIRMSCARVIAYALREDNRRFSVIMFMEACRQKETSK